jgi:uncharacterized lipoprotein NlpE involved in copper resistance
MKNIILISISILLLSACQNNSKKSSSEKIHPVSDNSRTSLDWHGLYQGVLPCADCEGIETKIQLNQDFSYTKKVKYLGKENTFSISKGNFSWDNTGNLITLEENKPNGYRVGENQLFVLDGNYERIFGDLKDFYILKKYNAEDLLFETYWKLVKLNNKTIPPSENLRQEAHIMFFKKDTMIVGSGSCNRFRGSFRHKKLNNSLSFKPISSTLMSCENLNFENKFLKSLENVSYYEIKNDSLKFFDKYKKRLATFIESENPSKG